MAVYTVRLGDEPHYYHGRNNTEYKRLKELNVTLNQTAPNRFNLTKKCDDHNMSTLVAVSRKSRIKFAVIYGAPDMTWGKIKI